ncbi:hypothetical protein BSF41_47320 [Flavobacterium sp. ACN2]|jgi:hypothetical protein|uniref:hypothetical protein n=1 Tax=Flavobacterium sp. ACN2 TaxID=1975676 RepID=UPI000BB2D3DE|nr:hypothetical protein [Flavobacterium sp. ACN2]PBI82724.1 hypothetical protein BSF41_47320 [Flavobacterium sp. ACN2]
MKKKTKGCLIFLVIIFLIIVTIISWIYYSIATSHERENIDRTQCEKTEYITEKPLIVLEKETNSIVNEINILLIRNNKIIDDTLIKNIYNSETYYSFHIPLKEFKKDDIVEVITKNEKYKISGFFYNLKSRWLMFGYNGGECFLDYSQLKINDELYNFNLLKEYENEKNKEY